MILPSRTPNRPKSVRLNSRAVSIKTLLKSEAVNFEYTQTPRTALHNKTFFSNPFCIGFWHGSVSSPWTSAAGSSGSGAALQGRMRPEPRVSPSARCPH